MFLNPRHVDLFREVVRHNGITKAALSLRIGQPFVSRAIARLEREIGFALFRTRARRCHVDAGRRDLPA